MFGETSPPVQWRQAGARKRPTRPAPQPISRTSSAAVIAASVAHVAGGGFAGARPFVVVGGAADGDARGGLGLRNLVPDLGVGGPREALIEVGVAGDDRPANLVALAACRAGGPRTTSVASATSGSVCGVEAARRTRSVGGRRCRGNSGFDVGARAGRRAGPDGLPVDLDHDLDRVRRRSRAPSRAPSRLRA